MRETFKTIALATWIAGVADIAFAMGRAVVAHKPIAGVLRGVAAGPFGESDLTKGLEGVFVGLAVHFVLMLVIVMVFVRAARWIGFLTKHPWVSGMAYGVGVYIVMYWFVLPQRWPKAFPQTGASDIAWAVFAHVACVGLPIALITARLMGPAAAAQSTH